MASPKIGPAQVGGKTIIIKNNYSFEKGTKVNTGQPVLQEGNLVGLTFQKGGSEFEIIPVDQIVNNSLILFEAFYSSGKNIFNNPEKIDMPTTLSTNQDLTKLFSNEKQFNELPNGYQLYLALFHKGNSKYSIHGLWLDEYETYKNQISLKEINNNPDINDSLLIHLINPKIIAQCNKLWYSGQGYPPSINLWNHEWNKHGTVIKKIFYKDLKPDQFLLTVLHLFQTATKKIDGKSLADNFVNNTPVGDSFLIPVSVNSTNTLEFQYTLLSDSVIQYLEKFKNRTTINK